MKQAIIVFTKVPKAGRVKTRLTEERGGILTPEEARLLYEACLIDVIDVCTAVDKVGVWICYDAEGDRNYLNSLITHLKYPEKIAGIFADQGGSFDECMQYAAEFLLKPGQEEKLAESILIVGGDVCGLQEHTLTDAIGKLEMLSCSPGGKRNAVHLDSGHSDIGAAMVVSADQEGGFNLAGYTCTTPFDFRTVFYNMQGITALEGLAEKARENFIPLLPLDIVFDIDLTEDLGSIIPMLNVLEQASAYNSKVDVPVRTMAVMRELGLQSFANPVVGWN